MSEDERNHAANHCKRQNNTPTVRTSALEALGSKQLQCEENIKQDDDESSHAGDLV